jgi:hypothetical protein
MLVKLTKQEREYIRDLLANAKENVNDWVCFNDQEPERKAELELIRTLRGKIKR